MDAKSGDWVMIHSIVLNPNDRAKQVPEDTKNVPLEMWIKGFVDTDANIGEYVQIKTITGRNISGKLEKVNPYYTHDYGKCIPELFQIGLQAKEILFGGDKNE